MSTQAMNPVDFKAEEIQFTKLKDYGDSGGKIAFLNRVHTEAGKTTSSLVAVKTSIKDPLFTPFGVNAYKTDLEWNKPSMVVGLRKEVEGMESFAEQLDLLRDQVAKKIVSDETWRKTLKLPKGVTVEEAKHSVKPVLKWDDERQYAPQLTLAIKKNLKNPGHYQTMVTDFDLTPYPSTRETFETNVPKLTAVAVIMKFESVWFINKNCGIIVKLEYLAFRKRQSTQTQGFTLDDVDSSSAALQKMTVSAPPVMEEEKYDSDEEETVTETVPAVVEQPVVTKKKTVPRKKATKVAEAVVDSDDESLNEDD